MADTDDLLARANVEVSYNLVADLAAALREREAELETARAENADLRWLVGHLGVRLPRVPLPPRLAPLFKRCQDEWDPSRFTLAALPVSDAPTEAPEETT